MTEVRIPLQAIKGRGTATRIAHRFERDTRGDFDDGWGTLDEDAQAEHEAIQTEVRFEDIKSAISKNESPDVHFDYGLNPYRGCEHGCVYCFARPTHSYLNLSPGLDFETKLIAKRNLAEVLAREISARSYRIQPIVFGSATDAYQPVERELRITRSAVEVLARTHHPMAVVTKGSGIERDLDLLAPMAQKNLVAVYVSLTTLDGALARKLDPPMALRIQFGPRFHLCYLVFRQGRGEVDFLSVRNGLVHKHFPFWRGRRSVFKREGNAIPTLKFVGHLPGEKIRCSVRALCAASVDRQC
jgi:hypothetical protein